jgi:type IV pilus assembly protein PilV
MEEDVMAEMHPVQRKKDVGFSMVELLMAAFILAIGLLGLTMLQAMSVRTAAGSHNLEMATQLAEQVMDQVELEGRQTYLNKNITDLVSPGTLGTLAYIDQAVVDQYFSVDPATGRPVLSGTGSMFHVQMTQTVGAGTGLSDVQVQVQFSDAINAVTNTPIVRTVTIVRRILHG